MFNFLKKGPVGQVTAPVAGSYFQLNKLPMKYLQARQLAMALPLPLMNGKQRLAHQLMVLLVRFSPLNTPS